MIVHSIKFVQAEQDRDLHHQSHIKDLHTGKIAYKENDEHNKDNTAQCLKLGKQKTEQISTYLKEKPDLILINSLGLKNNENIKINGYRSYTKNIYNEAHDGSAILKKDNIKQNTR